MLVLRTFPRIKICRNSDFKRVWHAIIDKIIQPLLTLAVLCNATMLLTLFDARKKNDDDALSKRREGKKNNAKGALRRSQRSSNSIATFENHLLRWIFEIFGNWWLFCKSISRKIQFKSAIAIRDRHSIKIISWKQLRHI